jgi:predicted amidohydrolase YtcJ
MPSRPGVLIGFMLLVSACGNDNKPAPTIVADRVFVNGAVYTVDAKRSWAEAVAVKDGEIIYVGDDEGTRAYVSAETEIIDLVGQMLLPGFHDSHIHILIGVTADDECDLLRVPTVEGVGETLKACTTLAGIGEDRWILGGGWGEWLWPEANPRKGLLDTLFPDRPVYLESSFGHAAWVNSRAMEIVGIDENTEDPPQGVIERDPETGAPSGTLRDAAMLLVKNHLPPLSLAQRTNRVRAGVELAHSVGITALIQPGLDGELLTPILIR